MPTRSGRFWSEHEGSRLSLVPWVPGDRAINGEMSAAHWPAYGALLARVHATVVTDALAGFLPREEHSHDPLSATVAALNRRLEVSVDEPAGASEPADRLASSLAQAWCASADRVSALLEGADRLGRDLRTRHTPGRGLSRRPSSRERADRS